MQDNIYFNAFFFFQLNFLSKYFIHLSLKYFDIIIIPHFSFDMFNILTIQIILPILVLYRYIHKCCCRICTEFTEMKRPKIRILSGFIREPRKKIRYHLGSGFSRNRNYRDVFFQKKKQVYKVIYAY